MQLPKSIKIGFHNYEVVFPHDDPQNEYLGDTYAPNNMMRISEYSNNKKLPDSSILQTLIHEILHAIDSKSDLDIFAGDRKEERLNGLAHWLCMVMSANKELMDLFR